MGGALTCCNGASVETSEDMGLSPRGGEDKEEVVAKPKPKKQLKIRNTIVTEEIGFTQEDIDARQASEDPDLDKLRQDAADRAEDGPKKRTKDRKGTNFVKVAVPISDELDDQGENVASPPTQKRVKDRKGTGAIKKGMLPPMDDEDDEEDEEEESKPVIAPKRVQGRKGTGAVKKGMLPPEEDEDDDEE